MAFLQLVAMNNLWLHASITLNDIITWFNDTCHKERSIVIFGPFRRPVHVPSGIIVPNPVSNCSFGRFHLDIIVRFPSLCRDIQVLASHSICFSHLGLKISNVFIMTDIIRLLVLDFAQNQINRSPIFVSKYYEVRRLSGRLMFCRTICRHDEG